MPSGYDAVIVGGGLSGLSLAAHLAAGPWSDRRVLLVDDGRHDIRARTWAAWTTDPGWLSPAVTGSWRQLAVHAAGMSSDLPLTPYRYVSIGGAAVHELAAQATARAPDFHATAGTVSEVADGPHSARVTIDGTPVTALWVFDSRPPPVAVGMPSMAFLGWELDTGVDAFDPAVVTFMDFRVRRPGLLAFCYVLPFSGRHALVEVAEFRWQGVPSRLTHELADDLADALASYLARVWGLSGWTVRRTEAGLLPLHVERDRGSAQRVVPIGIRGGMLKPSTGFALDRIQRNSRAISAALAMHDDPHAPMHGRRRDRWMDAVFLDVLRDDPDLAESIFARMFTRNTAPAILRFLDEDATLPQVVRIAATLREFPFARTGLARLGAAVRP